MASVPPLGERCPRWERCNAAVCPLLPDWRAVRHTTEDRVCLYLTEMAKPGGVYRVAQALGAAAAALLDPLQAAYAVIHAGATYLPPRPTGPGHGVLAGVLARAAGTGSRLAAGARLRRPTTA